MSLSERRNQFHDKKDLSWHLWYSQWWSKSFMFPTGSMSSTPLSYFSSLSIMAKAHSSFFIGSCPLAPWAKKKNSCLKSEILFFIHFVTVDFIYKFFTGLLKSLVFETCLTEIIWSMSSVHNTFAVSLVKIGLGYYFSDSASLKGNLAGCSNLAGIKWIEAPTDYHWFSTNNVNNVNNFLSVSTFTHFHTYLLADDFFQ